MATEEQVEAAVTALLEHMYPGALAYDLPIIEDARIVCRIVVEAAERAALHPEQGGRDNG